MPAVQDRFDSYYLNCSRTSQISNERRSQVEVSTDQLKSDTIPRIQFKNQPIRLSQFIEVSRWVPILGEDPDYEIGGIWRGAVHPIAI